MQLSSITQDTWGYCKLSQNLNIISTTYKFFFQYTNGAKTHRVLARRTVMTSQSSMEPPVGTIKERMLSLTSSTT